MHIWHYQRQNSDGSLKWVRAGVSRNCSSKKRSPQQHFESDRGGCQENWRTGGLVITDISGFLSRTHSPCTLSYSCNYSISQSRGRGDNAYNHTDVWGWGASVNVNMKHIFSPFIMNQSWCVTVTLYGLVLPVLWWKMTMTVTMCFSGLGSHLTSSQWIHVELRLCLEKSAALFSISMLSMWKETHMKVDVEQRLYSKYITKLQAVFTKKKIQGLQVNYLVFFYSVYLFYLFSWWHLLTWIFKITVDTRKRHVWQVKAIFSVSVNLCSGKMPHSRPHTLNRVGSVSHRSLCCWQPDFVLLPDEEVGGWVQD